MYYRTGSPACSRPPRWLTAMSHSCLRSPIQSACSSLRRVQMTILGLGGTPPSLHLLQTIFSYYHPHFSRSVVSDSLQPHGLQHARASLSTTNSRSLLKLMSIELVMPSNNFILCCPLLLLPSIFPSIRVFSNESVLPIRWPKYWSFSFSISPSMNTQD